MAANTAPGAPSMAGRPGQQGHMLFWSGRTPLLSTRCRTREAPVFQRTPPARR